MQVIDLLTPDRVFLDLRVADKRRLIEELARRAAAPLDPRQVAEALEERERLGSTGMGAGIAMPHARFPSLRQPVGCFARLRAAVDFDAIDERRVDLAFLLLLPAEAEGHQLNALACVARRLRDERVTAALRAARDAGAAYAALTDLQAQ